MIRGCFANVSRHHQCLVRRSQTQTSTRRKNSHSLQQTLQRNGCTRGFSHGSNDVTKRKFSSDGDSKETAPFDRSVKLTQRARAAESARQYLSKNVTAQEHNVTKPILPYDYFHTEGELATTTGTLRSFLRTRLPFAERLLARCPSLLFRRRRRIFS